MHTSESIILYAVEVWADALRFEKYRKPIAVVQRRGTLCIMSFYCATSEPTDLVIAGVIPIDLLDKERQVVHNQTAAEQKASTYRSAQESAPGSKDERWSDTSIKWRR